MHKFPRRFIPGKRVFPRRFIPGKTERGYPRRFIPGETVGTYQALNLKIWDQGNGETVMEMGTNGTVLGIKGNQAGSRTQLDQQDEDGERPGG